MTATEADGVPWLRFLIIFQTATIADITELCLLGIIIISSDVKNLAIWPLETQSACSEANIGLFYEMGTICVIGFHSQWQVPAPI